MKKKLLATALFVVLSATLVSCSNSIKDDNKNNNNSADIVEETYYTVDFETNGGSQVESLSVLSGDRLNNISTPTKASTNTKTYKFEGWYYDSGFNNKYYSGDTITSNVKLYAKWTEATRIYKLYLSFNYQGSSAPIVKEYNYAESIGELPTLYRTPTESTQYNFTGWYTDQACTEAYNSEGATANWEGDLYLYGGWDVVARKYPVYFETNGGSTETSPFELEYGSDIPFENIKDPTKRTENYIEYRFAGWYLDEELTIPVVGNEKCLGPTQLYAKWDEVYLRTYNVTTDADGNYCVCSIYSDAENVVILPEYRGAPIVGIDLNAFKDTNIKKLVIPSSITYISEDAFKGANIKELYYNGTIAEWANIDFENEYSNPGSVSDVTYFKEEVHEEGMVYFNGTTYIRPVCITIPGSVEKISNYAFYNMYFNKVLISDGVKEIGDMAFYSTKSIIGRMYVPASITKIGRYALDPTRHLYYGGTNSDWENIEFGVGARVGIDERINDVYNDDGYMFAIIDGTNYLLQYLGNDGIVDLSRPFPGALNNGTRYNIKKSAFEIDITIRKVIISDYVDTIEQFAFYEAYSINVLVINSSSTTFAEKSFLYAFNLFELYNLTNLSVPETSNLHYYPVVTHESIDEASIIHNIDGFLFAKKDNDWWLIGCDTYNPYLVLPSSFEIDGESVSKYYVSDDVFGRNTILELRIPASAIIDSHSLHYILNYSSPVIYLENIEEIYSYYFDGGFDLVLPNTIEKIYEDAFVYLEGTLYFMGTKEEWNAIENEDDNIPVDDIYFYSEEEPVESGKFFHLVNGKVVIWE